MSRTFLSMVLGLILFAMFSITTFSQDRIHKGVIPDKLAADRLREIHKSNAGDLQALNDIETLLLKSKSRNLQTALRNQQRKFYGTEELDTKDKRTNINKTILGNGFLLIEEIDQDWNGSAWLNRWKYLSSYDANNNQTEWLEQTWDGSTWVNGWKYSDTYDGNDNWTETLAQYWESSAWVNSWKNSSTYDGNNNQIEGFYQTWDGSAWVNSSKWLNTYDGNNNLTQYLVQTWAGSAWVNSERGGPYTYDVNNNMTERFIQTWDGSAWVGSERRSYTYDVNNNRTEWLVQIWDGSAWVNDWGYLYTYDGNNNQIEELYQTWDGSVWVIHYKYTNTYDGNNNLTQYIFQSWDGSAWVNKIGGERVSFTYDENNNRVESLMHLWDGSKWMNNFKNSYTYVPVTAINEDLSSVYSYNLSNNYPNPFNPSTTIQFQIPKSSFVNLKVYDILGSEVASLVNEEKPIGSYEVDFNAANLPSGVYLYKLQADNFIDTKKMLFLK